MFLESRAGSFFGLTVSWKRFVATTAMTACCSFEGGYVEEASLVEDCVDKGCVEEGSVEGGSNEVLVESINESSSSRYYDARLALMHLDVHRSKLYCQIMSELLEGMSERKRWLVFGLPLEISTMVAG
jgi:hypothetical protein